MQSIMPIPDSIIETEGAHGTMLVRRWRMSIFELVFLALFCAVWDSCMGYWWWMAVFAGSEWYVKIFLLPHGAVGIYLPWFFMAMCLNRTEILVEPERMTIRHLPVPWIRKRQVYIKDIAQLFVLEKSRGNSYRSGPRTFELHMVDRENGQRQLLEDLKTPQEALYLEQRLKELLTLSHKPVAGRE